MRAKVFWGAIIWLLGLVPLLATPFWPRSFVLEGYLDAVSQGFSDSIWIARGLSLYTLVASMLGFLVGLYFRLVAVRYAFIVLWAILAIGTILPMFWGTSPRVSLGHIASLAALLLFGSVSGLSLKDFAGLVKPLLLVYVLGSLLAALIAPSWALEVPYLQGYLTWLPVRLHGVTVHAIQTALLAWLLLALELAFPWKRRILRFATLIAAVLVLLLTQSKTTWALAFLTLSYFALTKSKAAFRRFYAPLTVVTASLLALTIYFAFGGDEMQDLVVAGLSGREDQIFSLTGRTLIWQVVLDIIRENPLFGYGPDLWGPEMSMAYFYVLGWAPSQSHNQYLQRLGEGGYVGLATFLIYLGGVFWLSFRSRRIGSGLGLLLWSAWALRGFTESWFRNATADGNLLVHAFILATVMLAYFRPEAHSRPSQGTIRVPGELWTAKG